MQRRARSDLSQTIGGFRAVAFSLRRFGFRQLSLEFDLESFF